MAEKTGLRSVSRRYEKRAGRAAGILEIVLADCGDSNGEANMRMNISYPHVSIARA